MKGRPVEKTPKKYLSLEELKEVIQEKRKEAKMLERLLFIKFLYKGEPVPQAAERVEVSDVTGYNWLERWNENGIKGLKPQYSGGPKPKLDNDQRKELKEILEERNDWTRKEIDDLIEEKFDVSYSDRHLTRILRDMGMNCGKPYQQDYRRPDDAEEKLKKTK